jgi:hypothetical protein
VGPQLVGGVLVITIIRQNAKTSFYLPKRILQTLGWIIARRFGAAIVLSRLQKKRPGLSPAKSNREDVVP